jgi:hypothetical protein
LLRATAGQSAERRPLMRPAVIPADADTNVFLCQHHGQFQSGDIASKFLDLATDISTS